MPPTSTLETFGQRVALETYRPDEGVKVGVTAKSGFAIKQGDVIGIITASDKARRRSRSAAAGAGFAANSAVGRVDDASVFAPGDELISEDGTAIGTVESIDTSTAPDTVTLTGNAAVAVASGDGVMASDGSQVAQGISDNETDGVSDTQLGVFISGILSASLCRGLDASAKAELGGATLRGNFKF